MVFRSSLCHFYCERCLITGFILCDLFPRAWFGYLLFATFAFALTATPTAFAPCTVAILIHRFGSGSVGLRRAFQSGLFGCYAGRARWTLGTRFLCFLSGFRARRFFRPWGVITVAARLVALAIPF